METNTTSHVIDLRGHPTPQSLRSLYLIDIENLCGGPSLCRSHISDVLRAFLAVARVSDRDLVIMAADISVYRSTVGLVVGARYVPGYGPDGADDALLQRAPAEWVSERFDRLVVGSGDHAFATLARDVAAAGVAVEVVSRRSHLSSDLRRAAWRVRYLPAVVSLSSAA